MYVRRNTTSIYEHRRICNPSEISKTTDPTPPICNFFQKNRFDYMTSKPSKWQESGHYHNETSPLSWHNTHNIHIWPLMRCQKWRIWRFKHFLGWIHQFGRHWKEAATRYAYPAHWMTSRKNKESLHNQEDVSLGGKVLESAPNNDVGNARCLTTRQNDVIWTKTINHAWNCMCRVN